MATLIYDADCRLCQRSVAFVGRHDKRCRIDALSRDDASALLAAHKLRQRAADTVVFVHHGRAYTESAAAVRTLWHLGGVWRLPAALLWSLPRPLRDAGYRWVARRRHRSK